MKKFEYSVKEEYSDNNDVGWLNIMGFDGWELISCIRHPYATNVTIFYFKREINEN